ncbi:replication initiator protein A, partial [uncultured Lactobacillus sp.]|uniref:replication initiator protein A n=1 Tax=uncultured Lactobacillus sp. TaxID=153152 RepID=UPI0025F9BC23
FFIPTTLFDNPKYNNLSSNAKLLYGIYTRRQQLSQMNQQKWQDKEGQVFFVFKNQEVGNYLGWGNGKVVRVKKELINYGLLVNKKTMSADHLYLLVPKIRKQDYYKPKDSARYSENNQSVKSQQQVKISNEFPAKHQNSKFSPNEHLNLVNKETKYINTNKDTNKSDTYIQTKNQTSTQIKPETLELDKQIFADTHIDILKILAEDDETTYENLKQLTLLAKKKALNFGHVKSSLFNFVDKDVKLPFYQCLLTILKKFKQNKIRNLSKYLYVSVRNLFEQIGNKRAQNFYNNTGKSIMWDSENYFGKDTVYIPAINKSLDNLFDYQAVSTTPD